MAAAVIGGALGGSLRRGPWRALAVVSVAFGLGSMNASVRSVDRAAAAALASSVPSCRVFGRTLEEAGGLGVLAALDRVECGDSVVEDAGAVFLDDFEIAAGRRFAGEGWLIPLGHESFDLARRRAGGAAALRVTSAEDLGPATRARALTDRIRAGLAGAVAPLGAPGQLLRGLTIGDTDGIDGHTEDSLRRSGLAHLLAVSGSNVAILLGAVALALRRALFVFRVSVCGATLALFVAVVGPDPSVLRAAGMGVIALVALAYGRRTEPLHALGLALVAVVALRPGIVYSTGLHLSAAATTGIVLWTRPLKRRLARLPPVAATAIAATTAAQVAVLPLLVAVFGRVPVVGLPANVLAVPAVAPATVLGLAAAGVGALADGPAGLLARAAAPFSAWILRVAETFGGVAWASPEVPRGWGLVLGVPVVAAAVRAVPGALRPQARNLDGDRQRAQPEER